MRYKLDISCWPTCLIVPRVANKAELGESALDVNVFCQTLAETELIWHRHAAVGLGLMNDVRHSTNEQSGRDQID